MINNIIDNFYYLSFQYEFFSLKKKKIFPSEKMA